MTVAALEAAARRETLAAGGDDLTARCFAAATPIVDHAWEMAVGGDLALPEVSGPRSPRLRARNAYVDRLLTVAERDPAVALAFMAVSGMIAHPRTLDDPALRARVQRGGRPLAAAVAAAPAGAELAEVAS